MLFKAGTMSNADGDVPPSATRCPRRASPVAPGHRAVLDLKQQSRHQRAGAAAYA